MIACNEDALFCDFVETYGILDYTALPVNTASRLACGLREDSRIRTALNGTRANQSTLLIASAVDALNLLVWSKTRDAQTGANRPESIVEKLTTEPKQEYMHFDSLEEFRKAYYG